MTTTRRLEPERLTDKTRALDAQATRGAEVTHMRERWASLQNQALERHGHESRVDHRSLEAQREAALARGDERAAETLDRALEVKLGPTARLVERARDEAADAPSFRTHAETCAFREEMERQFDPGTLARLGRGEERALAEVADNRLDGLCLARAWLDCRGEPERSEARLSLAYRIVDAQHDARRERQAHEREGTCGDCEDDESHIRPCLPLHIPQTKELGQVTPSKCVSLTPDTRVQTVSGVL